MVRPITDATAACERIELGGEPCRLIAVVDVGALVQRWQAEFGIDVSASFTSLSEIRMWRGEDSGIVYFDPPTAGDESLYQTLSAADWYYLEDKWEHQQSLKSVRQGDRLLEVGCGRGAYLGKAQTLGAEVVGVELNSEAARFARGTGLEVSETDIFDAPASWSGAFDRVSCFQVVEHVPYPVEFSEQLFSFVKPGGQLHVAVPNSGAFMGRTDVLLDFPPHHLTRWDARALAYLGQRLGAARVQVVPGPLEPMHVDLYLAVARKRYGPAVVNRLTRPIARALLRGAGGGLVSGHSILAIYTR